MNKPLLSDKSFAYRGYFCRDCAHLGFGIWRDNSFIGWAKSQAEAKQTIDLLT